MPDAALNAPVLGATKKVKLDGDAFAAGFHGPLVHQSVRAEQAARRRGTAATKTRAMVSGGSAKPWRQKGTGRARAGSSRSPLWTGGGTAFGPQPRSYTFKVNRKEQRAALRSALSLHAGRGSLAVVDPAAFEAPSTSRAFELLEDWNEPRPTLVALAAEESDVALSFRNLARVSVLAHENVGVADLLGAASVVLSQVALDALTARAGGGAESKEVAPAPKTAVKDSGSKASAKGASAKAPAKGADAKAAADAPATSTEETPKDDSAGETEA
jgi:large subunit ribosomal protein L4